MIIYVSYRAVLRQDDVDTFHGDEWRSRRHAAIVRCLSWNPRLCCSGLRTAFACVFFCASLSFNMWLLAFSSAKLVHICWLSSSGQIRLATWFSRALLESQHLSSLSPGVMFRCTEILFRKCAHSIWQQQFKWILMEPLRGSWYHDDIMMISWWYHNVIPRVVWQNSAWDCWSWCFSSRPFYPCWLVWPWPQDGTCESCKMLQAWKHEEHI